jgi:hypothetical protein
VRAEPGRHAAGAAQRQLLGDHRVGDQVRPRAAEFLLVLQPEEPELADALVQLAREVALRLPLLDVRADLAADEVAHRRPQGLVLLGEQLVAQVGHHSSGGCGSRGCRRSGSAG